MPDSANSSRRPLESLCLYGVGLAAEMFDQSNVWDAVKCSEQRSILPVSQNAFSSDIVLRQAERSSRSANTLASGIQDFVSSWPIPSLSVWPNCKTPSADLKGGTSYFAEYIGNVKTEAGLEAHRIASLGAFCLDDPEEVLERTFQFMDGYPEVPAILLYVSDGDLTRSLTGDTSRASYWTDGPRRHGSMCETSVALLLARPERVDALKSFVMNRGGAAPEFNATKHLQNPWSIDQLRQFYSMTSIAELHRPIRISYRKDKDGKPTFVPASQASTMRAKEKEDAAKAGLGAVLGCLNAATIGRVFYDTGGPENGANVVPLCLALGEALPDLDLFDPKQGYDIHARIGNTGAASPFVQWVLAAMATVENKDVSLTANLRQKDEMTITAVSPAKVVQRVAAPAVQRESVSVLQPTMAAPQVKIGTRVPSGMECPQSGMWKSDRQNADGGSTYYIPAGRALPKVVVENELSSWQKLRGESGREQVSTVWTLVSYEMASA